MTWYGGIDYLLHLILIFKILDSFVTLATYLAALILPRVYSLYYDCTLFCTMGAPRTALYGSDYYILQLLCRDHGWFSWLRGEVVIRNHGVRLPAAVHVISREFGG